MEPVKIEELKDQTEQNISTAEESASEAPSEEKKERLKTENSRSAWSDFAPRRLRISI